MIQYVGTIFLALYLFCYVMDRFMFEGGAEVYRNYSYGDIDENNGAHKSLGVNSPKNISNLRRSA
jgi:hypothetical protein